MKHAARFLWLISGALVAACGGGGGAGAGGVSLVPTNLVALDASNAPNISGAVLQASDTAYNFGKTGSAVVQGVAVPNRLPPFSLAKLAKWQLLLLRELEGPLSAEGIGILATNKAPCDNNEGTVSVTNSTVADGSAPTVGDSYSVSFAACFIQDTQSTLDGSLTMSIVSFTGNPLTDTSWSMSAKFTFKNLSSSDAAGTSNFGGGYNFTLTTGDGITFNGIIQSDSFTETRGELLEGLRNLSVDYSIDRNTQQYTLNLHGLYGSTALSGAVNFDTRAPFIGTGKGWPYQGNLGISGANNTGITLLGGASSVQLSIDSNGDGIPDATQNVNWVTLVTP